jgi:murein DD-endopeptidase MepM/ murein hydrolase activator NlpD
MSRFANFLQPFWRENQFLIDLRLYFLFLYKYLRSRGYRWFSRFESMKDVIVDLLYKRRGKYARPFLHFGTIALVFIFITFGPLILEERRKEEGAAGSQALINNAFAYDSNLATEESQLVKEYRGGEVYTHTVQEGETFSSIAEKYGLKDINTILWENGLEKTSKLKPGQQLRILPVDGVRHKVARGETIYTIAKKYGLGDEEADAQAILSYPFNEFKNDETFELAIGQTLMVPGGVKPAENVAPRASFARTFTPDAGTVTAAGSFVWPAQGILTQRYSFYHKAYDIANRAGGPILAADSGTVIVAGWPDNSGYANRVMIDHGNGYVTLYAHMRVIQVQVGQRVSRGNVVGQMGCTGRCSGTHLHFEIRHGGVLENPGNYLR